MSKLKATVVHVFCTFLFFFFKVLLPLEIIKKKKPNSCYSADNPIALMVRYSALLQSTDNSGKSMQSSLVPLKRPKAEGFNPH